jgi:hypothetical protein
VKSLPGRTYHITSSRKRGTKGQRNRSQESEHQGKIWTGVKTVLLGCLDTYLALIGLAWNAESPPVRWHPSHLGVGNDAPCTRLSKSVRPIHYQFFSPWLISNIPSEYVNQHDININCHGLGGLIVLTRDVSWNTYTVGRPRLCSVPSANAHLAPHDVPSSSMSACSPLLGEQTRLATLLGQQSFPMMNDNFQDLSASVPNTPPPRPEPKPYPTGPHQSGVSKIGTTPRGHSMIIC